MRFLQNDDFLIKIYLYLLNYVRYDIPTVSIGHFVICSGGHNLDVVGRGLDILDLVRQGWRGDQKLRRFFRHFKCMTLCGRV